jgi:hypothetical protein
VLGVAVDWIGLDCVGVCLGRLRFLLYLYILVDTWTFLFICLGRMVDM